MFARPFAPALLLLAAVPCFFAAPRSSAADAAAPLPAWRKIVVDPAFRSEGVAVADVNRDGKADIMVGDFWYEAPAWKKHEIRPLTPNLGDGAHTYSEAFCVFADDVNGDRWPDMIVVGFPGKPCVWYENPQNAPGDPRWKERTISASACNETPIFVPNLLGDKKARLVFAVQPEGRMCWFSPPQDNPDAPWIRHAVSEANAPGTQVFSHGLGAGDVNNDGRPDVLVKEGWWEQPRDAKTGSGPWTFHPADLGEDCANFVALDLNGDGKNDAVSSSAHRKGIWWHEQGTECKFSRHLLLDAFSQSHALVLADLNGDRRPDIITGKRWWAHGPDGDVEPNAAPVLVWIEAQAGKNGRPPAFAVHPIDDASGIGTQFVVADMNGDKQPDIVVSNKRGVFVFAQVRPGRG